MNRHYFAKTVSQNAISFFGAAYALSLSKEKVTFAERGLDTLLIFAPESYYWIKHYDAFGFAMFHYLILGAYGRLKLLKRAPDQLQAQQPSTIDIYHIHIWTDVERAPTARNLVNITFGSVYRRL